VLKQHIEWSEWDVIKVNEYAKHFDVGEELSGVLSGSVKRVTRELLQVEGRSERVLRGGRDSE
jgi:hypothetical protein